MDQQSPAINPISPPDVTVKRKRGRPKKDKSLNPAKSVYTARKRDPKQNCGEKAPVPPGFEVTNGNQVQSQAVHVVNNNSINPMVGQVVTGVIEAVFDAGFLLSVRVADSNTCLRGVVFKAGHYVPVTAENDIAPSLQMIKRNEVPFPVGAHSHKHRDRDESGHRTAYPSNGTPSSNKVARVQARQMSLVPVPSPVLNTMDARGTVVPVILQPVSLSNSATPAIEAHPISSQPAHLAAAKSKHTSAPLAQEGALKNTDTGGGSASLPFEKLVTAAKKIQGCSEPARTQKDGGESSSKMLPDGSGLAPEKCEDFSKPLLVEPLQTIHPGMPGHAFSERRAGKMTELLMAVQENLERQKSDNQHPEFRDARN